MLNVVMYIFLILGGLLALAIIFAIGYILVNRGNVVSSANENAFAGSHSVALEKPAATGVYILRVNAGKSGTQMKIRL